MLCLYFCDQLALPLTKVEQRRTKYDRIHFGVQKRQEKIEKMHQTLVDLEKQAEHLGLNYNSRSGTNKKPTKSISRRPIHVNTQVRIHIHLPFFFFFLEKKG